MKKKLALFGWGLLALMSISFASAQSIANPGTVSFTGNNVLNVDLATTSPSGLPVEYMFLFFDGVTQIAATPWGASSSYFGAPPAAQFVLRCARVIGTDPDPVPETPSTARSCPTITLSPFILPNGVVGTPYSQTLTAMGGTGPYTFAVTGGSLPTGLALNSSSGLISGTPTSTATANFDIRVVDNNGCSNTIDFTITPAGAPCPAIIITPNPLPNGTVGVAYSASPTASPAASYSWSAIGLPDGLTIHPTTGAITGTPTSTGTATITATTTINGSVCSGTTTLAISCPVITITPSTLANGVVGSPYTASLMASGGASGYSWSSTGLPLGLMLNSGTGLISGTPTATGTATITVTDINGCAASIPLRVIEPGSSICIEPDLTDPEKINLVFTRSEDPVGVEYCLEFTAALGNPTTWGEILLIPANLTIVGNGDGTETVTIRDIEALTSLTGGQGFVRLIAKMNGNPVRTSSVQGWKETTLGLCCQTYNVPFQRCATFTGTVSSVSGQGLTFTGKNLSNLLAPNVAHYAEVISGDNAGQRFDIVSATGSTATLANDNDLCAATAPFNTLTGAPPASLVGDTVAIHPHWTLNEVFPPAAFGATNDQTTADQIQIHAGGNWTIYWLYANSGNPIWVDTADAGLTSQGNTVIPPGQGSFFNNRSAPATVLSYGEVRENRFVLPLCAGLNLVGGGYPVTESPALRGMNNTTFTGTTSFITADSILIWDNDDTLVNTNTYTTRWLLNASAPFKRWVKTGDSTATSEDNNLIFPGDRASFIRRANASPAFSYPATWSP